MFSQSLTGAGEKDIINKEICFHVEGGQVNAAMDAWMDKYHILALDNNGRDSGSLWSFMHFFRISSASFSDRFSGIFDRLYGFTADSQP